MDSSILDASAFYAGVPFGSTNIYYTTHLVYGEIRHIKKSHDALAILVQTGRLKIVEPDRRYTEMATSAAKKTGDFGQLSEQDVSVVALALQLGRGIVTDDYAIANVAKNLKIRVLPVMTGGIKDVGRWIYYCPGCRSGRKPGSECSACGTRLKRKLVKK